MTTQANDFATCVDRRGRIRRFQPALTREEIMAARGHDAGTPAPLRSLPTGLACDSIVAIHKLWRWLGNFGFALPDVDLDSMPLAALQELEQAERSRVMVLAENWRQWW